MGIMDTEQDKHERMNERALNEYHDKEEAHSMNVRGRMTDKYDYEANKKGCIIIDYDKYRRGYIEEAMLLIGVIGLYFMIGLIFGVVITLT